jgi:DNA-binding XRE family transcriptional regulator
MLEIRILEVFKHAKLSRADFAQALGISNAVLSHISSGRNKPSLDLVLALLKKFPEIHPEWLLLGNGPMLRKDVQSEWQKQQKEIALKVKDIQMNALRLHQGIDALSELLKEA